MLRYRNNLLGFCGLTPRNPLIYVSPILRTLPSLYFHSCINNFSSYTQSMLSTRWARPCLGGRATRDSTAHSLTCRTCGVGPCGAEIDSDDQSHPVFARLVLRIQEALCSHGYLVLERPFRVQQVMHETIETIILFLVCRLDPKNPCHFQRKPFQWVIRGLPRILLTKASRSSKFDR